MTGRWDILRLTASRTTAMLKIAQFASRFLSGVLPFGFLVKHRKAITAPYFLPPIKPSVNGVFSLPCLLYDY
jgi:hypothetical protein